MNYALIGIAAHALLVFAFIIRILIRPHRDPMSRVAWIAVVTAIPLAGMVTYILFGELNVSRRQRAMQKSITKLSELKFSMPDSQSFLAPNIPDSYKHLFLEATSINGFKPVGGNSARLLENSNAAIDSMVKDIDSAKEHVHLLFYIWLDDKNGCKIIEALKRAAARGVQCRAIADGLGSRALIKSKHWKALKDAGVHNAVALPIKSKLFWLLSGRMDLRNHRKILIIDGFVTYCGSQNCADPEFRVKAKYAPWVDIVMRFEGPIVRENQILFAGDWQSTTGEDLSDLLTKPLSDVSKGFTAQVFGTGPTIRYSAMPEMFTTLFHAARKELTISTPYYVPNESMQSALCAAARRGVQTTIIFPAKNDSFIVGAASRSYYTELLEAGVIIYEYVGGLLHAKTLTLDGEITLIGSANMDRRSFDLNYENNILFYSPEHTLSVRARQGEYIAKSKLVTLAEVQSWPARTHLWNNIAAMAGPLL